MTIIKRIRKEAEALKTAKRVMLEGAKDKQTAMAQYDFELWKQKMLCKKFLDKSKDEHSRTFIFKYKYYLDNLSNCYASLKKLEGQNDKKEIGRIEYTKKKYELGKEIIRLTKHMNKTFRSKQEKLNLLLGSVQRG